LISIYLVVAKKSYSLLGLQSFYTVGVQESRAWKINQGTTASKAVILIFLFYFIENFFYLIFFSFFLSFFFL